MIALKKEINKFYIICDYLEKGGRLLFLQRVVTFFVSAKASLLFCLARKGTKRAYRDPRTLVPLGTAANRAALGIGSRGFF